jgi:hypothetical protein
MATADLTPVTEQIYWTLREWFPSVRKEKLEELSFAIAHDTLHLDHVEGELWAATIPMSEAVPPTSLDD